MDAAAFENVAKAAMSSDNQVRKPAEAAFEQVKQNPDQFLALTVQLIRGSQDPAVRQFAAVMLRKNLKNIQASWAQCSPATREGVKNGLLEIFKTEEVRPVRKAVSDAIGTLSELLLKNKSWPELIPALLTVASSAHEAQRESVLAMLENLCEFSVHSIPEHLNTIKQVIMSAFQDKDGVRIAALKASVSLLLAVDEEDRVHMADCVPLMFGTMMQVYEAGGDEDLLSEVIAELVNVPRMAPTFLRPYLKDILALFVPVVADTKLEPTTRRIAMEFMISLAETGKGMVRKDPDFPVQTIRLAFSFALELKHTPEWDTAKEDDDDDEESNFIVGLESLDRLAMSFGGKIFMQVATPIIKEFMASPQWLHHHAALMAISSMAEGCKKALSPQLGPLLALIVPMTNKTDEHPRVRWAAVNALAQLSQDFVPKFQTQFHAQVMPALIGAMDVKNHPRVAVNAAVSIVDFAADAPAETVEPYMDALLSAALALLKSSNLQMQEGALSAVSAVAILSDQGFSKYYDAFMPGIMAILVGAAGQKELRMLRGKAMECVALVGKAVGKEKFGADAVAILELLFTTQNMGLDADDPQYAYMVQALSRICECLGEAFVPYLQHALPPLLTSAGIDNACTFSDADSLDASAGVEGFESLIVDLRAQGEKRITINTALMEEKVLACNTLYQYVLELEEGYYPYAEQTATLMVPLVRYPYHDGIRVSAVAIMPALFVSAAVFAKKNKQEPKLLAWLWNLAYKPLIEAVQLETVLENLNGILEALGESIEQLQPDMLTQLQMQEINLVLAKIIDESNERRAERDQVRLSPDFDEQQQEVLDEENESEDEFMLYCHLVISKICILVKGRYLPLYKKDMHRYFWPLLDPKHTKGQINAGMCVLDDVIAYCGPAAKAYVHDFLPVVLNYAGHELVELRHSAAWGIGACATVLKADFVPVREQALRVLLKMIAAKDAKDEENEACTDNAISAVGKICVHCYAPGDAPVLDGKNLLGRWLTWLPLQGDEEEAKEVHDLLADLVQANHPHVLGDNHHNLPQVIRVLATALDSPCMKPETPPKIKAIWVHLASMPQVMQACMGGLDEEQREKMATLVASS